MPINLEAAAKVIPTEWTDKSTVTDRLTRVTKAGHDGAKVKAVLSGLLMSGTVMSRRSSIPGRPEYRRRTAEEMIDLATNGGQRRTVTMNVPANGLNTRTLERPVVSTEVLNVPVGR